MLKFGFDISGICRNKMRFSLKKIVALLMLFSLLMSLCAYGFNAKWLGHELSHDREMLTASFEHDHAQPLDTDGDPATTPLSDSEHHLIHAVDHAQPLLAGFIVAGLPVITVRTTPLLSRLLALPLVELEPPLRPPRLA